MTSRKENIGHISSDAYTDYLAQRLGRVKSAHKVMLNRIALFCEEEKKSKIDIFDINALMGDFLLHASQAFPGGTFLGGANSNELLAKAEALHDGSSIEFTRVDVPGVYSKQLGDFNVVLAKTALMQLSADDYRAALKDISKILRPGGLFINLEWITNSEFTHRVYESHPSYETEIMFYVRPASFVQKALKDAGMTAVELHDFNIDQDLAPESPAGTQTRMDANGTRMQFRGDFYQPWKHVFAMVPKNK